MQGQTFIKAVEVDFTIKALRSVQGRLTKLSLTFN